MAKQKQNSTGALQNLFSGSINQDVRHFGLGQGDYLMARNAINKNNKGDGGTRITEPSNVLCVRAPFVIIGAENLEDDWWVIFSTNNTVSEIGYFRAKTCTYTRIGRSECIGFKTTHLITSVSRPAFDGTYNVYFDDKGLNVSRFFNTGNFPFIQECTTVDGCTTCVNTEEVDCSKLRLESFINIPCLSLAKGPSIGTILNGSYSVFTAYIINGQRVSDYNGRSNILSIFSHQNINSSIEVSIAGMDEDFDEFELIIVSVISEKTVARRVGIYSTRQTKITLDFIDNDWPVANLNELPIVTPVPDKSEGMFKLGNYLTRINPSNKFEFNYQPLANQIRVLWQSVEYPTDYYKKGGTNVGYMRDEVAALFLRWIYNTGDKTVSYHIPGRVATTYQITDDTGSAGPILLENDLSPTTINDLESPDYLPKVFEVYNTARITGTPNTVLPDGGIVIAEGLMGYHESTEIYDDENGAVWNANILGSPQFDLCGKPIRHHRFPDNVIVHAGNVNKLTNHYADNGNSIRVMGFKLENVQPPRDNQGNLIPGIVGYEVLRGSRNGEKTVLFKGMINNMFQYDIPNTITNRKGLYANYPFNDLRPDPFISKNPNAVTYEPAQGGLQNYEPNDQVSLRDFTFHSPDTMIGNKPFLEADELKLYGIMHGQSRGYFTEPDKHPRHKFVTDASFAGAILVGFGYSIAKMNGTRDAEYHGFTITSSSLAPAIGDLGNALSPASLAVLSVADTSANAALNILASTGALTGASSIINGTKIGVQALGLSQAAIPTSGTSQQAVTYTFRDQDQTPEFLRTALLALGNPMFLGYMSDGADTFLNVIRSVGAWRQYALQYQSYCGYERMDAPYANARRRFINLSRYLDEGVQEYGTSYLVNHKLRNETVIFTTKNTVPSIVGSYQDVSRPPLISDLNSNNIFDSYLRRASSYYVAFKSRKRNQYGQLSTVIQVPATTCYMDISQTTSNVIFGGDTYIGKYSEKNTLFYFDQWLKGEPDGAIFNYFKHKMFEHTAFWMDTDPFDLMEFIQSVPAALASAIASASVGTFFSDLVTPSDKHCFDRLNNTGFFLLKNAFFYLFNSGVREFFVESEINVDYRDWEDDDDKKHYPVISDLKRMFGMDLITVDNYYKFDRSLSVSFLAQNKIKWAALQDKEYNPVLAETVFAKRNRRLIYSLPQETGAKKDAMSVFLPLNYKDFTSNIVAVKPIGKSGGIIFFETEAPGILPGADELKSTSGAKITIGDGALFTREIQRLDNSELSYQHGSCQNRLSIVNTPVGIFYMAVNQGEIFFTDGQSLKVLSNKRLRRFLNLFLPYKLIKDFPTFDVLDNPVAGIGCQSSYLSDNNTVYFCKKDWALRRDLPEGTTVVYIGNSRFLVDNYLEVRLGDSRYFENASFTISWDISEDSIISFHDWHPDLFLAGPNVFHTTKLNGLWKHNSVCNSFCNFYGNDYPFEIHFSADDKFNVSTLRNIEYYLESYLYGSNCYDRHHVLTHNFNKAIITNSEQASGVLNLIYDNGLDPSFTLRYPIIRNNSIDILYSKEEQKYRFNQFWDITRERGEFSNVRELIWNTFASGYEKVLNPNNLNYSKHETERKKFRHFDNEVILIREQVGNIEMVVSLSLLKTLDSPR